MFIEDPVELSVPNCFLLVFVYFERPFETFLPSCLSVIHSIVV